jgi:hypothetical protein
VVIAENAPTVAAWLLGFPILLVATIVLGLGNLGFTLPSLLVLLALWLGPAAWFVGKWRGGRGSRAAGDAA